MWGNTGPAENADEQDERYPYFPVDTGNPMAAAISTVVVVVLLVLGAWVSK